MSTSAYEDVEGDNRCTSTDEFRRRCILQRNHREDHYFETIPSPDWSQLPPMNQKAYFREFQNVCEQMVKLTMAKNSDYAEDSNAFANFETITQITGGRISVETGIVVRLTDKLKRIGSLLSRPARVHDEKIEDTVFDMAVYSVILLVYMRNKNAGQAGKDSPEKRDR